MKVTLAPPIASCCSTGWSASSARRRKPLPRTYVAQEVTTFFSDGEADEVLKRSCTTCHDVDRVNEARFSPDRWRVVTVDMRERGAKLNDDELERLVEWLGPHQGNEPEPMKTVVSRRSVLVCARAGGSSLSAADERDESSRPHRPTSAEPGSPVKIRIQRWSTDEEATPLVTALESAAGPTRWGGPADAAGRAAGAAAPAVAAARGAAVVVARRRRAPPRARRPR